MSAFNSITSAIFNVIMAPFGHGPALFDLLVWPVVCGIVALVVYKYLSNQKGIERAKDKVKVHIYEIRLFGHDPLVVLLATAKVFLRNFVYLGHQMLPMVVLTVPMLTILVQLEAHYAFDPSPVGSVDLLKLTLDPDQTAVTPRDVKLAVPDGVHVEAGPVRTADGEVYWRLKADAAGDHPLTVSAGDQQLTKTWSVGGEPRKVSTLLTKSWESFLYPGDGTVPGDSPFYEMSIKAPERQFPWLPDGEMGVLMTFFGLSLVAGFALKDVFGVTL